MNTISITKPTSASTDWGTMLNTALDAIVTGANSAITSINANPATYAPISHNHTGNQVTMTYKSNTRGIDYIINDIISLLTNFSSGAYISSVTISGETNVSNFVVENLVLSKLCFPLFQMYYFWSTTADDVSGFGTPITSASPSLAVLKPATGYDVNNQIYLHCKFQLFNPDGTQSGYDIINHTLVQKWQGNFTVDEIAVALTNNDDFVNCTVGSLAGSNLLASKVSGIINANLQ